MKISVCLVLSLFSLVLWGEQLLTLSMDKVGTIDYMKKTIVSKNSEKNIDRAGDKGLIFANFALNEFKTKSNKPMTKAVKSMWFSNNFEFPKMGYVDVVVKPFFNDKRKKRPHNYIYSFYSNDKKFPDSLRLFFVDSNTIVTIA